MMILARANRPPRAAQTEATRAEQRFRNRIISLQHVSRARRERIYDNVVSSFRHPDLRQRSMNSATVSENTRRPDACVWHSGRSAGICAACCARARAASG